MYIYCVIKYHVHSILVYTVNAKDTFRCSISCEIMLMIKARVGLIFSSNRKSVKCVCMGNDSLLKCVLMIERP